jgi:hypothetical protein
MLLVTKPLMINLLISYLISIIFIEECNIMKLLIWKYSPSTSLSYTCKSWYRDYILHPYKTK